MFKLLSLAGSFIGPKLILAFVMSLVLSFGVWKWKDMQNEIIVQRQAISVLEQTVDARELELKIASDAQTALEDRLVEQSELNDDLTVVIGRINNAPENEDGPVAPVLRRALDDIAGLRINNPKGTTSKR